MNPVVLVNVSIGASSTVSSVFDIGAILTPEAGTGTTLGTTTRFAYYASMSEILNGESGVKPAFADSTETYKAAAKYFGVTPAPRKLLIIYFDPSGSDYPNVALLDAINKGAEFYGVYYIPKASETAANILTYTKAIDTVLNSIERGVQFYGFTGTVVSSVAAGTVPGDLYALKSKRAVGMYCTTQTNDAAGLMGVAMGYGINAASESFALCYKGIDTATANDLSETEVNTIKGVNANVFVTRSKIGAKVEKGTTASGLRYDETLYIDMISKEIQEGLYETIANSQTKLPASDSTTALFIGEIYRIMEQYYNIGVLGDAVWRGTPVGDINTGDMVQHGYYAYAESYDTQSEADRLAHKAMPITALMCLTGSVESVVINLHVQT